VPTAVALLVNPTAGRGRGARLAGPVAGRLRALGVRVDVVAGADAAGGLARARARRVSLAAPGVVAYADGERVGPLPVTCEVVPAALRVLAPEAAAAAP
jgi:diacylglycerol kinase family enzyme